MFYIYTSCVVKLQLTKYKSDTFAIKMRFNLKSEYWFYILYTCTYVYIKNIYIINKYNVS